MPIHKLKLLEKKIIAQNILLLTFEKPTNFHFIPGQYGGFTLPHNGTLLTRRFSLLSAPEENVITIATRMQQSPFKTALSELAIGEEIKFAGPTGQFTLHDTMQPVVMIAGGIGITPFYCMLKHAVITASNQFFYLFYGNNSDADSAFLDDLVAWQNKLQNFKLITTLANPPADWQGESGFITAEMIKKHVPDLFEALYYVCGSPAMVSALQEELQELEIDTSKILIEDFPGY